MVVSTYVAERKNVSHIKRAV